MQVGCKRNGILYPIIKIQIMDGRIVINLEINEIDGIGENGNGFIGKSPKEIRCIDSDRQIFKYFKAITPEKPVNSPGPRIQPVDRSNTLNYLNAGYVISHIAERDQPDTCAPPFGDR